MINNLYIKVVLFSVLFFIARKQYGQDLHFSQYYNFPTFTNPANTGDTKGSIRAVLIHRRQWSTVAIPYSTSGFSLEGNLYKNRYKTRSLGAGIMVLNDNVGEFQLKTNIVVASVAGSVKINAHNHLALGFQGGFGQKRFDPSKLKWGNQYNGLNYDPNIGSGEQYYYTNVIYNDISAGINLKHDKNTGREGNYSRNANKLRGDLGVSVYHLNRPNTTLNDPFNKQLLYRKLVVNGSLVITNETGDVSFLPSILCEFQGPDMKYNIGGMTRYLLKEGTMYTGLTDGSAFSVGAYYRYKDAFILATLYEYRQVSFGISYDVNISKFVVATSARGGIEFSLRYMTPQALTYTRSGKRRTHRAKF